MPAWWGPITSWTATRSTARASPTMSSAATPTARSPICCTCRSSRRCRGAVAGTTSPLPTARRSASTCAWSAYPYTTFVLESNSNDSLVALGCVGALLAATLARDYAAGLWTGVAVGLGAASKFVSLTLAPLFARRAPLVFGAALLLTLVATVAPFVPDGGLRALYDRTVGYQASRPSPFSIWGQVDSLDWLQTVLKGATVGLALLVAFVPRQPELRQTAALGAAVLIAVQLVATHWFYLYIVWFVPFLFVAMFAAHPRTLGKREAELSAEREPVLV